ncbi:hypothetical protein SDC9_152002 [bioreactor metagenome]|uniref:Uncharacterized protein n=1 Tax=bioreactor metagenome TaxID=1076179 RepID=A0A645ERV6_9ZZZZ
MAILVAHGGHDGRMTRLGHRQKMVWRVGRTNGVDRDANVAIGAVLEADRARQTRSQFAMHLRLGRPRADGAPGDQVSRVLRRDGIEEFCRARQAQLIDLEQDATRQTQAFVDAEGVVEARVVDQAFPAHRGARLLEIHAHDNDQVVSKALGLLGQLLRVVHRQVVIVNRARADDDQQTVIGTMQGAMDGLAGIVGGLRRPAGNRVLAKDVGGGTSSLISLMRTSSVFGLLCGVMVRPRARWLEKWSAKGGSDSSADCSDCAAQ